MRRWDSVAVGSHHLRRLKFELEFRNDTQLPIVLEAAAKERRSQKLIPILRSGPLRRNQAPVRRPHCPIPNRLFADFFNTIGTFETCRPDLTMSVFEGKADFPVGRPNFSV